MGAAGRLAGLEVLAERLPGGQIGGAERRVVEELAARRHRRDDAHSAAHDQPRRGSPASGRAALVIAHRPETLFQGVVGGRQLRHIVAVEEPRGVLAVTRWNRATVDASAPSVPCWVIIAPSSAW